MTAFPPAADFFFLLNQQSSVVNERRYERKQAKSDNPSTSGAPAERVAARTDAATARPTADLAQQQQQADAGPAVLGGQSTENSLSEVLIKAAAAGTTSADLHAFLDRNQVDPALVAGPKLSDACSEALVDALQAAAGSAAGFPGPPAVGGLAASLLFQSLPRVLRGLLQLGADPNYAQQISRLTPLSAAIKSGCAAAVTLLLEAGAKADAPVPPAPVSQAAGVEQPSCSVAPTYGAEEEAPALELAALQAAVDTAAASGELPPGTGSRKKRRRKCSLAAQLASEQQQQQQERQLPAQAELPSLPSPLVMAIAAADLQLMDRLIASGADLSAESRFRDKTGRVVSVTPLIAAVSVGSAAALDRLLAAGADVQRKCQAASFQADVVTALSTAVTAGQADLVRRLLEAGACGSGVKGQMLSVRHPAVRAVVQAASIGRVDMLEMMYPRVATAVEGGHRAMVANLSRSEARSALAAAAHQGQLAALAYLLEQGAPADDSSSVRGGCTGFTPLHLAAEAGHLAVVQKLLACGASPLAQTSQDDCPASLALREGHLDVVAALLEGSASDEQRAQQQSIMVHKFQAGFKAGHARAGRLSSLEAVKQERQQLERLIVRLVGGCSSTDVQAEAASATASMVAWAAAGSERLLKSLLALGARVSCVDVDGNFPLLHACWCGWPAMQRLLAAGADPNQASAASDQTALLLLAGQPGLQGAALQLLSWPGVDLWCCNTLGQDAVGLAIQHKNRKVGEAVLAKLMAEQQSSTAPANGQQQQPPPQQVDDGRVKRVYDCLQAMPGFSSLKGSVNAPEAQGEHILIKQVRTANRRQVQDLLSVPGINVNATGSDGSTVLMCAVRRRSVPIVEDLLACPGLDLEARNASGATALLLAAQAGCAACLMALVRAGASVHALDHQGCSALMYLALRGQHKPMQELISKHGAAVNAQDARGWTPLHYAAERGLFSAVKVLRCAGADPMLRNHQGQAAEELAGENGQQLSVLLRPPPAGKTAQLPAAGQAHPG